MTLRSLRSQTGLSLVELMIAMALSLLLMLGVLQIFLSSKQTYTTNSALSRLQENGRFAMDFITYDLRNAGYKGECLTAVNNLISNGSDDRYNLEQGIKGWEAQTNLPAWPTNIAAEKILGTDSILINHAAKSAGTLSTADVLTEDDNIALADNSPINTANSYIVISSALGCDIFKSGTNAATGITKTSSGNLSQNYSHLISKVLAFQSNQYFVKNGISGIPTLWRVSRDGASELSEELIEGILDLQFEYGLGTGTGENVVVSSYVKANAVTNWENVISVKVRLLALGGETNTSPENQIYDREKGAICKKNDSTAGCSAGDSVEIPDRRLAQVFSATVGLRNRLP